MTSQRRGIWCLAATLLVAGCADYDSEFDSLVDDIWLDVNAGRLVDAAEFLEGPGWHYDTTDETTVDEDLVIPLCREIEEEFSAECDAVLYDDDSAGEFTTEILVKLSPSSDRAGIRSAVEAADAKFAGEVTQQWGVQWMAFSFVDE